MAIKSFLIRLIFNADGELLFLLGSFFFVALRADLTKAGEAIVGEFFFFSYLMMCNTENKNSQTIESQLQRRMPQTNWIVPLEPFSHVLNFQERVLSYALIRAGDKVWL